MKYGLIVYQWSLLPSNKQAHQALCAIPDQECRGVSEMCHDNQNGWAFGNEQNVSQVTIKVLFAMTSEKRVSVCYRL